MGPGATWYPHNHNVFYLEPMHLNDKLLGTLCERRRNAIVVMENLLHSLACISLVITRVDMVFSQAEVY